MANQGNEKKFGELILYVSKMCSDDPLFGSTKLNKILYFADFLAYGRFCKPITGVEYFKLPEGPAPRRLKPLRDEMVNRRDLAIKRVLMWNGKTQVRTINLREPDLEDFTGREIALVDEVIKMLRFDSAKDVSEKTHKMAGWHAVGMQETIPYATILISNAPLSAAEIYRGQQLASEIMQVEEMSSLAA